MITDVLIWFHIWLWFSDVSLLLYVLVCLVPFVHQDFVNMTVSSWRSSVTLVLFCSHRVPWWRNGSWLEFTVDSSCLWLTPSRPKQSCVWWWPSWTEETWGQSRTHNESWPFLLMTVLLLLLVFYPDVVLACSDWFRAKPFQLLFPHSLSDPHQIWCR